MGWSWDAAMFWKHPKPTPQAPLLAMLWIPGSVCIGISIHTSTFSNITGHSRSTGYLECAHEHGLATVRLGCAGGGTSGWSFGQKGTVYTGSGNWTRPCTLPQLASENVCQAPDTFGCLCPNTIYTMLSASRICIRVSVFVCKPLNLESGWQATCRSFQRSHMILP